MDTLAVHRTHSLTGHKDCIYALAPGDEPHFFFSAGGDGMVALWDLRNPENGQLVARLPHSIYAIHYHQPSGFLLAGQNYSGIHVLDWKQKQEVRSLQLTTSAIFDIQSHGNDIFLAAGDGSVISIDFESWQVKSRVRLSAKSARAIAIHPAAGEIAVGYSDHTIRILSMDDLTLRQEWIGHQNSVFTLAYTPDYKRLLSGSRDARLKSWNPGQDYALAQEVVAHLYAINHIAFSPDSKHFVTCSLDKSIKVWRADNLALLKVIDKSRHAGHGTSVNKLLWTTFDNQLLSASDDRTISIWNIIFSLD